METRLMEAKNSLDSFYASRKGQGEEAEKKATSYLGWVNKKTVYIRDERLFVNKTETITTRDGITKTVPVIRRGRAFWIQFGFNIGQEFGGHHPGIVLKTGGETAVVVPLSTQEPTPYQKTLVNYVEIDAIAGFPTLGYSRWVNLLNVMPISFQRFELDNKIGNVPGPVMQKLSTAMNQLWRP